MSSSGPFRQSFDQKKWLVETLLREFNSILLIPSYICSACRPQIKTHKNAKTFLFYLNLARQIFKILKISQIIFAYFFIWFLLFSYIISIIFPTGLPFNFLTNSLLDSTFDKHPSFAYIVLFTSLLYLVSSFPLFFFFFFLLFFFNFYPLGLAHFSSSSSSSLPGWAPTPSSPLVTSPNAYFFYFYLLNI